MDFKALYAAYESDLKNVEQALFDIFSSSASLIPAVGQHIIRGGGKRIRPLFLLVSAGAFGYKGKNRITLASVIEAIHTASLLHDDVIDGAHMRRGQPTANSLWGNQVVVLVGDFLYSNALRLAVFQRNQTVMEHLSSATTCMTEGELLQLSRASNPDITEEDYLKIIAGKTGALISAACSIGAIIAGADDKHIEALADFGMKAGMAFQMADDILDYAADQVAFGKKLGKDLEEGKITLPIIELLASADTAERKELRDIISITEHANFEKSLERVFALFKKYDTINTSMKKASQLTDDAKHMLDICTPSPELNNLKTLADYALIRTM